MIKRFIQRYRNDPYFRAKVEADVMGILLLVGFFLVFWLIGQLCQLPYPYNEFNCR